MIGRAKLIKNKGFFKFNIKARKLNLFKKYKIEKLLKNESLQEK